MLGRVHRFVESPRSPFILSIGGAVDGEEVDPGEPGRLQGARSAPGRQVRREGDPPLGHSSIDVLIDDSPDSAGPNSPHQRWERRVGATECPF